MKTLKVLFLSILLISGYLIGHAHTITCSITCPLGECTSTGASSYCHCGASGEPVCGHDALFISAGILQAKNILLCKHVCMEFGTISGNRAALLYQGIYDLLETHGFTINNSSADFSTIKVYISELENVISSDFNADERAFLEYFISGLTY